MKVFLLLVISYFLGAIPFAYIFTRLLTGKDVRQHGSGNVGATNASRVMGIKYGFLVAGLDILKGFFAVLIVQSFLPADSPTYLPFLAAVIAILGHNWSIFLRFSGGKGVATTFGVLLKLLPSIFLIYALIWLLLVVATKYVSLASVVGALSLPIFTYIIEKNFTFTFFILVMALLITLRHKSNIARLLSGQERKFKFKGDFN